LAGVGFEVFGVRSDLRSTRRLTSNRFHVSATPTGAFGPAAGFYVIA
jgi:hypothetical protein